MATKKHIALFVSLLCVSWSGKVDTDGAPSETLSGQERELADAVNDFGYKMVTKMMKQNVDTNVVISPTGVAGLLAMTLLGSVGGAYDELAQTLGFSQDILSNRQNHEQFGNLLHLLNANDTSSQTIYADAIFVDEHTQIRDLYRTYLKRVYHGDALAAKFGDIVKAKELINDWVKGHTNGKIEDFLLQPLPMSTKVVLLSALYFNGQWAQPFLPEYTMKMAFARHSSEVKTDLMLNTGEFNYSYSIQDGFHIIALPYNDSITTMYVLKPLLPKQLSLPDLMDRLDYKKIDSIITQMVQRECVVRFPKMELKTKANLEESLKSLGIKSIFSPSDANFALMIDGNKVVDSSEEELITRINSGDVETRGLKDMVNGFTNPGVYVDSVLHDVKITINEYGTEAVAATSSVLARSAVLFYADSPFYMFIRNERTKLVTFSAAIVDPTA